MKLLITLSYWQGDYDQATKLCNLLADLEKEKTREADILLLARYDAPQLPADTIKILRGKFDSVIESQCSRPAKGYPYGANEQFYFLMTQLSRGLLKNYDGWLNLEPDVVPLRRDWIKAIKEEWYSAAKDNFWVLGNTQPTHKYPHTNGVAMYRMDIGLKLFAKGAAIGGPPHVAYDVFLGSKIQPKTKHSDSFKLFWKQPTISPAELFSDAKVYLAHGIKDDSALEAVREKLIGSSAAVPIDPEKQSPGVVFTYLDPVDKAGTDDQRKALGEFNKSWKEMGFRVKTMSRITAENHPQFDDVIKKIAELPNAIGALQIPTFVRWLALAEMGGGFFAEHDVVNGRLRSTDISPEGLQAHIIDKELSVVILSKRVLNGFINFFLREDMSPYVDSVAGNPHLSDRAVLKAYLATLGNKVVSNSDIVAIHGVVKNDKHFRTYPLIHVTESASVKAQKPKYAIMAEEYLHYDANP